MTKRRPEEEKNLANDLLSSVKRGTMISLSNDDEGSP